MKIILTRSAKAITLSLCLFLGACDLWHADGPLMPKSSRDITGLSGLYTSSETPIFSEGTSISFRLMDDRRHETTVITSNGRKMVYYISFDLVDSKSDGGEYKKKYYVIEVSATRPDDGEVSAFYLLGYTSRPIDGRPHLTIYQQACSKAAKRISKTPGHVDGCEFTGYDDVKLAADVVLSWLANRQAHVVENILTPSEITP